MTYDKPRAIAHAARLVTDFVAANKLPRLEIEFAVTPGFAMARPGRNLGYYVSATKRAHVFVDKCRPPSTTAYSWTWPGYKADLTVLGVTAHEAGHHVSAFHPKVKQRDLRRLYKELVVGEKPLTSYAATCTEEDIAESVKLFITNPTLLWELRPLRYGVLALNLELRPVVTQHWREVLADSPRHIACVENNSAHRMEHET